MCVCGIHALHWVSSYRFGVVGVFFQLLSKISVPSAVLIVAEVSEKCICFNTSHTDAGSAAAVIVPKCPGAKYPFYYAIKKTDCN